MIKFFFIFVHNSASMIKSNILQPTELEQGKLMAAVDSQK